MKPDLLPTSVTATTDAQDWLTRYRPCQHIVEPGFWIVLFCTQAMINAKIPNGS